MPVDEKGQERVGSKEYNSQKAGRAGGGTPQKPGPVTAGIQKNPTKDGGINRATKGE